jgi:hypothetical protein
MSAIAIKPRAMLADEAGVLGSPPFVPVRISPIVITHLGAS